MKRLIAVLLGGLALVSMPGLAAPEAFPRPPEIEPAVRFWTRVYTQVTTDGGLIHDRHNLAVVYEAIKLKGEGRRARSRQVDARKAHYRTVLRNIARKDRSKLNAEERRVLALWPEGVTDQRLRRAASRGLRFQLGQADKFRAGLERSGAWEPHIRRTLEEMGLPRELAALPHVESSFNPRAWSRVGAAGIWQFTRSTGRRYMRIDHVVDERMDPFKSSIAAARLLEHNHSVTRDWALAVTAYNHGLAGVRRAARQVGSNNIATIIDAYSGRNWGFASRNFYPSFLAAVEVDFNAEKYFGLLERRDPLVSETIELPFYTSVSAISEAFDVDRKRLRELNRALRDPVWAGKKRVPRGYDLRVPAGAERPPAEAMLARVEQEQRYFAQIPDRYHRVQPGEALSTIAARYDVATRELVALNNLRSRNFIRAGQTLRLPVSGDTGGGDRTYYTVRPGDTLSGIAERVGMATASLARANGLGNSNRIYPGQELRVDGRPAEDVEITVATADTGGGDGGTRATDAPPPSVAADAGPAAMAASETPAAGETGGPGPAPAAPATAAGTTDVATAKTEDTGKESAAGEPGHGADGDSGSETHARLAAVEADAEALAEGPEPVDATAGGTIAPEQPALSADPADYGVAADGTIEVQAAETLGHYAEWLDLRASQLRRINDMRYGKPVIIGHRLQLRFTRVAPEAFQRRREAYHEELQARFFEQFRITGTEQTLVERGDSLWTLARRTNNVPLWLLRQYNPDLDFEDLHPGMPVTLPKLERQPNANAQPEDEGARAHTDAAGNGGGA